MGETEEFNTLAFEKRLMQLKDTQESIQSLSSWCLKQRSHHKKIVSSWLNVLKRVKVEQRLVLFYLANDVIQYSKRKNYEFVESWGLNLQKATPLVRFVFVLFRFSFRLSFLFTVLDTSYVESSLMNNINRSGNQLQAPVFVHTLGHRYIVQ